MPRLAVGLLAVGLFGASLTAAEAQTAGKPARLGILYGSKPNFTPESNAVERAFVEGLAAHGYVVGRDVLIEFRSAEGKPDRYPALAKELVGAGVDIILAGDTRMTAAAREATHTIPIVMAGAANPVAAGLIQSYARPGGNVTGVTLETADVTAKRVELLRETLPGLRRIGALYAAVARTFPVVAQWLRDTERRPGSSGSLSITLTWGASRGAGSRFWGTSVGVGSGRQSSSRVRSITFTVRSWWTPH